LSSVFNKRCKRIGKEGGKKENDDEGVRKGCNIRGGIIMSTITFSFKTEYNMKVYMNERGEIGC